MVVFIGLAVLVIIFFAAAFTLSGRLSRMEEKRDAELNSAPKENNSTEE